MKHLITLLLLALSINSNAQSCNEDAAGVSGKTIPVFAVLENNGSGGYDTLCWYMNRAEIIAYVATAAGSVTTLSSGNLSPLFTSSVANPTTTPAISYSLSNAAAYTVLTNSTNATAAPAYAKVDPLALKNNGGTASSSTYYRGDGQWATPAGGGADSTVFTTQYQTDTAKANLREEGIHYLKTTISSEQILTINTTPVEIVPAPGAGKVVRILGITIKYDFVSAIYTGQLTIYQVASPAIYPTITGILSATADAIFFVERSGTNAGAQSTCGVENAATYLSAPSNPTTGDGNMIVYVHYEVITL